MNSTTFITNQNRQKLSGYTISLHGGIKGGFILTLTILLMVSGCGNSSQAEQKLSFNLEEQLALEKVYLDSLLVLFPEAYYEKYENGLLKDFFIENFEITVIPDIIKNFIMLEGLVVKNTLIEDLPDWLGEMEYLVALSLARNNISVLPEVINRCRNLKSIIFFRNPIKEFKLDSILPNLERLSLNQTLLKSFPIIDQPEDAPALYLNLSGTLIKEIPKEVGQMKISELWMSDNVLEYIAPEIGDIEELHRLELRGSPNLGANIPETLGKCKRMSSIGLDWCGLTEFPMFITELTNMQTMSLDNNLISEIPPEIGNLTKLSSFHIKENRLTTLPKELNNLPRLRYLGLEYNQISSLPEEMFDIKRKKPCVLVLEGNPIGGMPVSKEQFNKGYKHYGDN